jgi:hypothetical protein
MASAELTSTRTPPQPAADLTAPRLRSRHIVADGHRVDFGALVYTEAGNREATVEPRAASSRGPAAFNVIAIWLRRALANSARAWAIAAGVPPDLYN